MKLPAVPSIAAEDTHVLFTKSMPEGVRIKSSTEAAIKPVTRDSSAKPAAGHEIPAQHGLPAQYELPRSATKVDKPVTSDVARQANMATMVRLYELECPFPTCDRGDGARYKTPKLV